MIDFDRETLLTFEQAAERVPTAEGRHLNPRTVWNWARHGRRGVKLDSIKLGGARLTSKEALSRFFAQLTEATWATEGTERGAAGMEAAVVCVPACNDMEELRAAGY